MVNLTVAIGGLNAASTTGSPGQTLASYSHLGAIKNETPSSGLATTWKDIFTSMLLLLLSVPALTPLFRSASTTGLPLMSPALPPVAKLFRSSPLSTDITRATLRAAVSPLLDSFADTVIVSPSWASLLSAFVDELAKSGEVTSTSSATITGTNESPCVLARISAVVWPLASSLLAALKPTVVRSQPCLPPLMFWALAALWFALPKVPDLSTIPLLSLSCEAKKLFAGLLGPLRMAKTLLASLAIDTWSLLPLASPSMALSDSFPVTGPCCGVQNPVTM